MKVQELTNLRSSSRPHPTSWAEIERRRAVPNAAYSAHPERFVHKPPERPPAPKEVWILCFQVSQTL
jgi:hypothetical protein